MTKLTEIDGVGPSYAEDLQDAGYESAEDVANADAEELDDVIERADGADLVASAEAEVLSEEVEAEADDESEPEPEPESETDDGSGSDTITLEPGFDVNQVNHLLRALVREEVRQRRTNNTEAIDAVKATIEEVKDGEPYELTLEQCNRAYTGISQLEQNYRQDRNLNEFVATIREVKQTFQNARSELHPE